MYQHFKGGDYEIIAIARDSEDRSRELVVYKSLDKGYVWVRPLEMFLEEVDKPEYNYKGPRFNLIEEKAPQ